MKIQHILHFLKCGEALAILLLPTILLAGLFAPLIAADIPVTTTADDLIDNGNCTLREAIEAANTRAPVDSCPAGDGDDRVLLSADTYTITLSGAEEDGNSSGDFDIFGNLQIDGSGQELTMIDGNQLDRVLHVHISATVTISGLSIVHGRAPSGIDAIDSDATDGAHGGAILNEGGLAITASQLNANQAGHGGNVVETDEINSSGDGGDGGRGGAIFNAGSMHIMASELYNNHAGDGGAHDGASEEDGNGGNGGHGGAIFNANVLLMTSTTVQANHSGAAGTTSAMWVSDGNGGSGGGVANDGVMTVTHGLIHANQALSGGGISNDGVTTLISSTVSANSNWAEGGGWFPPSGFGASSGDGGGICNHGQFEMYFSTVANNHTANGGDFGGGSHTRGGNSGAGGGIFTRGLFTITQSTVSDNWTGDGGGATWGGSSGSGGGVANIGILAVENSTIVGNSVGAKGYGAWGDGYTGRGGGIYNASENSALMQNTILATNYVSGTVNDCAGTLTSHDYNLVQNLDDCLLAGDITQTLTEIDPQILPLGDHGGPTPTNAVGFNSPVIDAGSCTDFSGAPIVSDQRGFVRPVGVGCDIGAIEVTPPTAFVYLPMIGR